MTELLRGSSDGTTVLPEGTPHPCAADLAQSIPVEFRADQILVYTEKQTGTGRERKLGALVIEVQRSQDQQKRYSWPAILRVLENRGLDVPTDIREHILACTDQDTLDTWLDRAITTPSAKELVD